MIDAKDLLLARKAREFLVQRFRGFQIVTERFFHDDTLPASLAIFVEQCGLVQLFDDIAELAGLRREIKEQVFPQWCLAESREHRLQLLIRRRVREIPLAIENI